MEPTVPPMSPENVQRLDRLIRTLQQIENPAAILDAMQAQADAHLDAHEQFSLLLPGQRQQKPESTASVVAALAASLLLPALPHLMML